MLTGLKVGVLALQGDFERHLYRLRALGVVGLEIRHFNDLNNLDGLIIPGGESTTMNLLLDRFALREPLAEFCRIKGVWGTCAGMIMLAREVDDKRIRPLGIIDISVQRNAYGRQAHSFHTSLLAQLNGHPAELSASFIRAPQVVASGNEVRVLAEFDGKPVLLAQRNCLVSSFHTELNDDLTLTKYYLENFVSVFK
ncbi:Glutamine amidotransferase subunit PdxT [Candidatus Zixiibacteriota bacterium]|nr:Glutamine amidotransferase subunit PdxT [candidate division Zixibacteria bacterium]